MEFIYLFLASMNPYNSDSLQYHYSMHIIFIYRAGNLMSPFNPETPILQIWEIFLVISLIINSAIFSPFCFFLSRTFIVWMLVVLNWSPIDFLVSSFFFYLHYFAYHLHFLTLLNSFIIPIMFFIFKSSFFIPWMFLLSHLVLFSWMQYLCLFLIIVTIMFLQVFFFFFYPCVVSAPSHLLACLSWSLFFIFEPFLRCLANLVCLLMSNSK